MVKRVLEYKTLEELKERYGKKNVTEKGVKGLYLLEEIKRNNESGKGIAPTSIRFVDRRGLKKEEVSKLETYVRREYQKEYSKVNKKKPKNNQGTNGNAPRELIRTTFNTYDLMQSPVEKTIRMLEKIINGERFFTM